MPIYKGNSKAKFYLGDHKIKKMYLGDRKVYSSGSKVTYHVDADRIYNEEVDEGAGILFPKSFTPEKPGYTFTGWRADSTASGNVMNSGDSGSIMGESPMVLYAVFCRDITLHYNGNGASTGSVAAQTGTCYYNNGNVKNPVFVLKQNGFGRNNYVFGRWAAGSTGGTQYDAGASITLQDDTTLYACWIQKKYSFEYTGSVRQFKAPVTGTYLLEVWGASGGDAIQEAYDFGQWFYSRYYGGLGGYSKGLVKLTEGDILNICVGGEGASGPHDMVGVNQSVANAGNAGGYNGGGRGYTREDKHYARTGGGGGATNITKGINRGTLDRYVNNRDEVLIVAGGGGGAYGWLSGDDEYEDYSIRGINGGYGGGLKGGCNINKSTDIIRADTGGTQEYSAVEEAPLAGMMQRVEAAEAGLAVLQDFFML